MTWVTVFALTMIGAMAVLLVLQFMLHYPWLRWLFITDLAVMGAACTLIGTHDTNFGDYLFLLVVLLASAWLLWDAHRHTRTIEHVITMRISSEPDEEPSTQSTTENNLI